MMITDAIAVLFILYAMLFLGSKVGRGVEDEIIPARKYLAIGTDALVIVAVAALGTVLYSATAGITVALALAIARVFVPLKRIYYILGGAIAGLVLLYGTSPFLVLPILLLNYLLGLQESQMDHLAVRGIFQPIMALLLIVIAG